MFVMQADITLETALRVYRRYLKLEPSHTEEYIAYLKSKVLLLNCLSSCTTWLTCLQSSVAMHLLLQPTMCVTLP